MPALLLVSASGTAQRHLIGDVSADLVKKGYSSAGKIEGGEWSSLLSDNLSGGLFDEKSYKIVEAAPLLGELPEKLSVMIEDEKDASTILILVYESEAKSTPQKFIPKSVLPKCRLIKAPEFPKWPRERQTWTLKLAKELGANLTLQGAALIVELLDDPEEIRAQLISLKTLKGAMPVSDEDVRQICMDDGSKNLLRLLDGMCTGNISDVLRSIRAISKNDELIPTLTPIHNRMRLAWYAGIGEGSDLLKNALAAKDYAWRMAGSANNRYGHRAITEFISDILRMGIDERTGTGAGWYGLEMAVIKLMGKKR